MAYALQIPPLGFDELPVAEKIEYIQALWERIAAHPEDVPAPQWHRELLAERISAHRAGDGGARPWSEVREEIRTILTW